MRPPSRDRQQEFDAWLGPERERFLRVGVRYAGGDTEVADEALQRTSVYIWEHWDLYGPQPAEEHVRRILLCRVRDVLRRRLTQATDEDLEHAADSVPEPGHDVCVNETMAQHAGCVQALPDSPRPMRTAYLLYQAGLNYQAIAARLGIPYAQARRLARLGHLEVRSAVIRRVCGSDRHLRALHGECVAALDQFQRDHRRLRRFRAGTVRAAYQLHWDGQPLGAIARLADLTEDTTLGLLEETVEHVFWTLHCRVMGG
jgi:DNA-directed RNA polymerase specialized sigma24 family protein